jgi:3-hydroxyisobutyrate dehydrogenase-like beta-hydroxyacid dehydrogenase
MEQVGFIGLGLMGEPMAQNLLKAGFALTVYNRTPSKGQALADKGAKLVSCPADVAVPSGIVVTMVADDRALEEVTLGPDGFGERLGDGGLHLCTATVSPDISRRLAAWYAQRGGAYVASPVFGRPPAAEAGKLWMLCAGPQAARQRVQPLLNAMGQGVFDFGEDAGNANVVKVAGNFLICSAIECLAEAFTVGEKNGIDRRAMAELFTKTMFNCAVYQNYAPPVAQFDPSHVGFMLKLGLKDVNLVLDAAEKAAVPMPVAGILHDRLLSAVAKGRGELDWSAMALDVAEAAGLRR